MSHRDRTWNDFVDFQRVHNASQKEARHEALAASKYPLTPDEQAELDKRKAERMQRIDAAIRATKGGKL